MNGKELKEEFKTKHGLSEMNGNITNYSEWLEDKLIALTKAENLPISDVRLSLPSIEEIETLERSIISADPTLADVCIKDLREQIFVIGKKLKLAIGNEA